MGWIQTLTGRRLPLHKPSTHDIDLDDIAWGLSGELRFVNQTRIGWSVAQHSLLVAVYFYSMNRDDTLVRMALMHDGPEYVLRDIPKPFKGLPEFQAYRDLEEVWWGHFRERFGFPEMPEEVSVADKAVCALERRLFHKLMRDDWEESVLPLRVPIRWVKALLALTREECAHVFKQAFLAPSVAFGERASLANELAECVRETLLPLSGTSEADAPRLAPLSDRVRGLQRW